MPPSNWDDAGKKLLMNFLLKKTSSCTKKLDSKTIGKKFMSKYPVYKIPDVSMNSRIRRVLNKIEVKQYDAATLAKLMFYLSHSLEMLEDVETKLSNSGDLLLSSSHEIIFYRDEHAKLANPCPELFEWLQNIKHKERQKQIEARRTMEFEREAQEMEERERINEEERKKEQEKQIKKEEEERVQKEKIQNQLAIKFEDGGEQNGNVNVSSTTKTPKLETDPKRIDQEVKQEYHVDPNTAIQKVETNEIRAPSAKRARVDLMHSVDPVLLVPFPTPSSTPALSIIGSQEKTIDYRSLLKSILNYSHVVDSECFEDLQADISEELNEPDVASKKISEKKIAEAIREGIKAATTRIKPKPLNSENAFSLQEFFRFWKLKLLEMEFGKENELVTEISSFIQNPDLKVAVKLDKIRLGLEMTLTKLRQ